MESIFPGKTPCDFTLKVEAGKFVARDHFFQGKGSAPRPFRFNRLNQDFQKFF